MENSEKLWTGEVPNNWKFYKGKYIFGERSERGNSVNLQLLSPTQKFGVIPQSMYDELTSMKSVKVKEDTDLSTFKTIHKGDFCISLRSFQGGFEYSEYEGVVSPAYHVLYPKMDICAGYYKYLFKEQRFIGEMNSYCQSLRDGKNISYFDFGRTLIPFPPLSEQQSIADYLDETCSKIDEIIAEAKASIDEYKELKQSVIDNATMTGIHDSEMKNTDYVWFPEMPKSWDLVLASLLFREDVRPVDANDVSLSLSQVDGLIPTDDMSERSLKSATHDNWKHVIPDDLVLNRFKGHLGVFFASKYTGMVSFHYGVYHAIRDDVYAKYYEYLFHSTTYKNIFALKSNGITVGLQNLSNGNFYSVKILHPTLDEQIEIVKYLDKRIAEIDSLIAEKESLIHDLEAYKKSLIYEVVTGKRRVV